MPTKLSTTQEVNEHLEGEGGTSVPLNLTGGQGHPDDQVQAASSGPTFS